MKKLEARTVTDYPELDVYEWLDQQWKNTGCTIRVNEDETKAILYSPSDTPLYAGGTIQEALDWLQARR